MKVRIILLLLITMSLSMSIKSQKKEIVAYFPEWGIKYKPYLVKNIENSGAAEIVTVINYAFAEPKLDSTGKVTVDFGYPDFAYQQIYSSEMSIDGIADSINQPLRGHLNQLKKLKARHPNIKILISIGGWLGSKLFSDAALTKESREYFVNECINIFINGNLPLRNGAGGKGVAKGIFDGIDIDWEFPISGGVEGIHHNPNDKDNLTELFRLFRKKLDEINPELMLTSAVPANKPLTDNYNIYYDQRFLNWYNLMTYDFYGGWSSTTGHHTNLYSYNDLKISLDNTVKLFRDEYGVSANKIIPGIAFYGRGWKDVSNINNGLLQSGSEAFGLYENGHSYFSELKKLIDSGYVKYWDKDAMAPWIYNHDKKIFWSFDDEQSVVLKTLYSDAHNLRGVMFWDLSGDDENGTLIKAIGSRKMHDYILSESSQSAKKQNDSIKIVNPLNDEYYVEGKDIIINTEIRDDDNSIIKVEFYVNNKLIGYDTEPPFDWVWFNPSEGDAKIKVVGIDKTGLKINSELVHVSIKSLSICSTPWVSGRSYFQGEQVIYNGKIYVCTRQHDNSRGANNPERGKMFWKLLKGIE